MKLKSYILLFVIVLSNTNLVSAEEAFIYGIYTNMNASSGEPSGMEMYFLNDGRPGKCNKSVLFQLAEGWPQYPELIDCCGCSSNKIVFSSKNLGRFTGHIESDYLVGKFADSNYEVKLKKGLGFWQK